MRSRFLAIAAALLTAVPIDAGAQAASDAVLTSARAALKELRAGVARSDWEAINRAVEVPTRWHIDSIVKERHTGCCSFWHADSKVDADSLRLFIQEDGSVRATGGIRGYGGRGEWFAVLDNVNGKWRFRETKETWGQ